ncbi:hypothetical protein CASFOL_017982 [Castilleja foliolosa]|uniref:Uncharacterized protein n=1 Tax=Castilleja foliolosa TaxID=1961234 RepID=A0ABD3D801_9LAMI
MIYRASTPRRNPRNRRRCSPFSAIRPSRYLDYSPAPPRASRFAASRQVRNPPLGCTSGIGYMGQNITGSWSSRVGFMANGRSLALYTFMGALYLYNGHNFNIPNLRVGTLDSLLSRITPSIEDEGQLQ